MIEVVVERSRFHFGDEVWIFERRSDGVTVFSGDGKSDRWINPQTETAERGEPTFRLPEGCREALGAALLGQSMPTDSMARHLADAVDTRDRLLTLVETLASPPRLIDFGPPTNAGIRA